MSSHTLTLECAGAGAEDQAEAAGEAEDSEVALGFEGIYARYFDFVWRNVRRLGVPACHVDDVTQEVFLVVHRRIGELERRGTLRAWIFAILARVTREHRRGHTRKSPMARCAEPPVDPDQTESAGIASDEALAMAQATRLLHTLLDGLDDDKRVVLVLADLEEMTVPEIAEAIGANVNTVYARLRAARKEFEQGAARLRAREGWRLR